MPPKRLALSVVVLAGFLFLLGYQPGRLAPPSPEQFRELSYTEQASQIKTAASADPVAAWTYLKQAFIVDGQVVGNAHEFSHMIGNGLYDRYGLDGVKYCDKFFAFGCFHGVSEKILQDQGVSVVVSVQNKCLELFPPKANQDYTGCIHGMGHGLLSWEGLNLAKALRDCEQLDPNYRYYCYDGVFMENGMSAPRQAADIQDPWKFCEQLDER